MDFTERLLTIMTHYGHNKNSFSLAIGKENNTIIGRLINERERRPSFEIMELILKRFPAINPTWLILGEGDMFITRQDFLPEVKDRLLRVTEVLRLSIAQIASGTGISSHELMEVIEGDKAPTDLMLTSIAKAFPIINDNWLLHNEGQMFREGVSTSDLISMFEDLPSGIDEDSVHNSHPAFTIYSSRITDGKSTTVFGVRVFSNEFPPVLNNGDYAIVRCVKSYGDLVPSDLVFIATKRRNFVRRIVKQPSQKAQSFSFSDGQGLTHEVSKDDITCVGLIISVLRIV